MKEPKYAHLMQYIGAELRRLRRSLDKKQCAAGGQASLDHSTVSLIEAGKYGCLKVETLYEMTRQLGVPMGAVLPPEEHEIDAHFIKNTNAEVYQWHNHTAAYSTDGIKDKLIAFLERDNQRLEAENRRLQEQINEEIADIANRPSAS